MKNQDQQSHARTLSLFPYLPCADAILLPSAVLDPPPVTAVFVPLPSLDPPARLCPPVMFCKKEKKTEKKIYICKIEKKKEEEERRRRRRRRRRKTTHQHDYVHHHFPLISLILLLVVAWLNLLYHSLMVLEVEQHAYLVDQEVKHRDVHLHFYLKKKKEKKKKKKGQNISQIKSAY